ncbi:MAG: DUF362 domain-containing protein [Deltaproteobacteria bacterium]|nr:DUF362 domain-containing protein [Deltaproteobacteria bacterium]
MTTPDVHYSDLRTTPRQNLLDKVEALLGRAGLADRVQRGDLVAVKLHFGEKGNTSFIRPVFVRRVVEAIKALGAKPFLTDANTLYVGTRAEAVSHLETAIQNGFDYAVVGAPLVIADGLRGSTSVRIPIEGKHFREVCVAAEIAHADAVVGLAHFKGHELSGFGGALKNLGMGCAAREGKLAQHSSVAPKVKAKLCVACGECVHWCAQGAIAVGEVALIDAERCVGCGECILTCPQKAIQVQWTEGPASLQEKMAEYCLGTLAGKRDKCVFVNFATQVSPACDCYGHSDAPIVADAGILCSADPVALDQACADLVNSFAGNPGSCLTGNLAPGADKFRGLYPQVDWTVQLAYAEALGLGSRLYRRVDLGATGA